MKKEMKDATGCMGREKDGLRGPATVKAIRVGIAVLVFGLPLAIGTAAIIGCGVNEGYKRWLALFRRMRP